MYVWLVFFLDGLVSGLGFMYGLVFDVWHVFSRAGASTQRAERDVDVGLAPPLLLVPLQCAPTDVVITLLELRVRPHTVGPPLRPQHSPRICEYAAFGPPGRPLNPSGGERERERAPKQTAPRAKVD